MTNQEISQVRPEESSASKETSRPSTSFGLYSSNAAALVLLAQLKVKYDNDMAVLYSEFQAKYASLLGGVGKDGKAEGLLSMIYNAAVDAGEQAAKGLNAQMIGHVIGAGVGGLSLAGIGVNTYRTASNTISSLEYKGAQKIIADMKAPSAPDLTIGSAAPTPRLNATQEAQLKDAKAIVESHDRKFSEKLSHTTNIAGIVNSFGGSGGQAVGAGLGKEPEIDKAKDQATQAVVETVQRQVGQAADSSKEHADASRRDANDDANKMGSGMSGRG